MWLGSRGVLLRWRAGPRLTLPGYGSAGCGCSPHRPPRRNLVGLVAVSAAEASVAGPPLPGLAGERGPAGVRTSRSARNWGTSGAVHLGVIAAVRRGSGREGMQTLRFLGGLVVDGAEDREAAAASGPEPHPVRVQAQHADLWTGPPGSFRKTPSGTPESSDGTVPKSRRRARAAALRRATGSGGTTAPRRLRLGNDPPAHPSATFARPPRRIHPRLAAPPQNQLRWQDDGLTAQ